MPAPKSAFVTLDSVSARTPDGRVLFDNVSLGLGAERTGLVGRNGVGKTTLARLILGEVEPAAGTVTVRGCVAVLRQALAPPPDARLDDLLGARAALARLDRIERGEPLEGDLEAADWTLPARLVAALDAMGLSGMALERPAASLSGGQATRASLAAVLAAEPDLLVMDEPTNNLDADGRAAVAQVLAGWRGGALVISHDRALLRSMDRIVELSTLGAGIYGGGYDLYAERKAEELAAAARELDDAERAVARVGREIQQARERKARRDAAGQRARARGDAPKILMDARAERAENTGGRMARLADRQRADAAEALDAAEARVERLRALGFSLPPSGLAQGKAVLAFEDVSLRWPDGTSVLEAVSFRLAGPQRLAISGRNGAGKSTLLRLATGDLAPTSGRIVRGVPAALLDQKAAALHPDETVLDAFLRLNPGATPNAAHAALARFLFRNAAALKPVGALSGGERLRAALACALMGEQPPKLIILDEPTNHLDLEAVAAVEAALVAYDGALVVVSHDADFLDAVGVGQVLELGAEPQP